jgi:hypothetical protein
MPPLSSKLPMAAGLLADDASLEPVWAPTPAYDEWQQRPSARRWSRLRQAWLASGTRTASGGHSSRRRRQPRQRPQGDVVYPPIRQLRGDVLAELADLPEGQAPDLLCLGERIRWRRPMRRPRSSKRSRPPCCARPSGSGSPGEERSAPPGVSSWTPLAARLQQRRRSAATCPHPSNTSCCRRT